MCRALGGIDKGLFLQVMPRLKPVEKCWQPSDVLPLPEDESFIDEVWLLEKGWGAAGSNALVVTCIVPEKAQLLL